MITKNENNRFPLPLENSYLNNNNNQRVFTMLPLFGVINMTITSGTTIYRAYNNGDIQMIAFVTFVFFGTFLFNYLIRLYNMLPPHDRSYEKLKLKIGIWVLVSSIMFGFACEFSTFLSLFESLTFFGLVISGNTFLFYVYFIWEVDKSERACCIASGGKCEKALENEYRPLLEGVDSV